jgi:hypothetical protein
MSEFGPWPSLTSDSHLALLHYRGAGTQNFCADPVLSGLTLHPMPTVTQRVRFRIQELS